MNEEITRDKLLSPVTLELQKELIDKYCSGLEGRLRSAPVTQAAQDIVDAVCGEFNNDCESEIVRSYLHDYVNAKFREIWKHK